MFPNLSLLVRALFTGVLIVGLSGVTTQAQVLRIEGRVVDVYTGEPLAFVHITVNDQRQGTTTGIQGNFSISSSQDIEEMHLSYVGYELKTVRIEELDGSLDGRILKDVVVPLTPGTLYLRELIFEAGDNPAEEIIRKAVSNKEDNNPENLSSFTYKSYNKFIIDAQLEETDDTVERASKMRQYLDQRYLFLVESVTERKYRSPNRSKETVLATRVSGLQRPLFTALANTFQPFSFYEDYLSILGTDYLNPLSKNSEQKYFFWLQDSLYSHGHKVYIISFEPRKKHFEGLRGLLYINTYKYAVENVIAETTNLWFQQEAGAGGDPRDGEMEYDDETDMPRPKRRDSRRQKNEGRVRLQIKVQQRYDLVGGKHWFPSQLNTDIEMRNFDAEDGPVLRGIGRSYLKDIDLFPEISSGEFDRMAVEYHPQAARRDSAYWARLREEPLSDRGKDTYRYLDSVGRAENFDRSLLALSAFATGRIPVGPVDLDMDQLIDFNLYEKVRLGIGLQTNERFSRVLGLGAYGAWAFGDRNFKYGGNVALRLTRKNALSLHGVYNKDVAEAGGTAFYKDDVPGHSQKRRRYMIERMDKLELAEAAMSFYTLKYLDARIALRKSRREPTYGYAYEVDDELAGTPETAFNLTEARIALKYAFRERFVEVLGNELSTGTEYPTVWLNATRGLDGFIGGEYAYWKLDLKIAREWLVRGFGAPGITLVAGIAGGDLPYPVLYNGNGSFESRIPLEASSSFQTMRLHEFASDRYVALHYTHRIGRLKWHPRISTPEFIFTTSLGIGDLEDTARHRRPDNSTFELKTLEKGYFESGVVVRDLYKLMGVVGLGFGYFYRYGPYSLDGFVDNSALKITIDFSL